MLIKVNDASWSPAKIPDCEELYRNRKGNIIGCYGSLQSVRALNNETEVVYVEESTLGVGYN
jgi:hypothetical protein